MKKLLLLSTLGVVAFAANQAEARRTRTVTTSPEVVIESDNVTVEGSSIQTDVIGHSGRPCRFTEHAGPTYKCPDITCPVCPKVRCQAELISDCPGCEKVSYTEKVGYKKSCRGGKCGRGHSDVIITDVVE